MPVETAGVAAQDVGQTDQAQQITADVSNEADGPIVGQDAVSAHSTCSGLGISSMDAVDEGPKVQDHLCTGPSSDHSTLEAQQIECRSAGSSVAMKEDDLLKAEQCYGLEKPAPAERVRGEVHSCWSSEASSNTSITPRPRQHSSKSTKHSAACGSNCSMSSSPVPRQMRYMFNAMVVCCFCTVIGLSAVLGILCSMPLWYEGPWYESPPPAPPAPPAAPTEYLGLLSEEDISAIHMIGRIFRLQAALLCLGFLFGYPMYYFRCRARLKNQGSVQGRRLQLSSCKTALEPAYSHLAVGGKKVDGSQ
mmetsp:Transcript_30647/g.59102  ORF Transcript_30647/g.59102 Transcript_30647/m.59102 type:complete len:306 (-) Transcript_30647:788-1705(-)